MAAALLSCTVSSVQANDSPFPTPVANPFEARIGSMYQSGVGKLRLDIGASIDLVQWDSVWSDASVSIGADFMTWTRLRSENNFKFPVETIDYWFGANSEVQWGSWNGRLRIAHISSHLVDGLADQNGTITPTPFVYSREFAEILVGYTLGVIRPYAGATFVWTKQPADPDPIIPQMGIDLRYSFNETLKLRGGYDLRFVAIDGMFNGNQAAQLGLFIDVGNERGFLLSAYGYTGRSIHGMFYREYDHYVAVGFQILW